MSRATKRILSPREKGIDMAPANDASRRFSISGNSLWNITAGLLYEAQESPRGTSKLLPGSPPTPKTFYPFILATPWFPRPTKKGPCLCHSAFKHIVQNLQWPNIFLCNFKERSWAHGPKFRPSAPTFSFTLYQLKQPVLFFENDSD